MGKNKSIITRISNALISKEIKTNEEIKEMLNNLNEDEQLAALKQVMEENQIKLDRKPNKEKVETEDKTDTLLQYFGKSIANLLMQRKQIKIRELSIDNFKAKSIDALDNEEKYRYVAYIKNEEEKIKLKDIDKKLEELGLKIVKPNKFL